MTSLFSYAGLLDRRQPSQTFRVLLVVGVLLTPMVGSSAEGACVWHIERESGRPAAVAAMDTIHRSGKVEVRLFPRSTDWQMELRFEPRSPRFSSAEIIEMLNGRMASLAPAVNVGDLYIRAQELVQLAPWDQFHGAYRGRYALPDTFVSRFGSSWFGFETNMANAVKDVNPQGFVDTAKCELLFQEVLRSRPASASSSTPQPVESGTGNGSTGAPPLPFVITEPYLTTIQLGAWRLRENAALFRNANANSQPLGTLAAGTLLRAVAFEIHVLRPTVAEAITNGDFGVTPNLFYRNKIKQVHFTKGERLYSLHYFEEGYCVVWAKGVVGIAECDGVSMEGQPELFDKPDLDSPQNDLWALVVTRDRKKGWIKNPDAQGKSRHDENL